MKPDHQTQGWRWAAAGLPLLAALLLIGSPTMPAAPAGTVFGDVDGDGVRDGYDLLVLGRLWDRAVETGADARSDLNRDGLVDEVDLFQLLDALAE